MNFFNLSFKTNYRKSSDQGVSYFYHSRKDFLKSYGLAHDTDNYCDESFHRRINTINCEYVVRPQNLPIQS